MFWKKKHDKFSLENLQYLHELLVKNPTVNSQNLGQLVEGIRLVAEVMIWGDQNDPRFFEFFCEKAFLAHFSKYLAQRDCAPQLQVQIIQSLSILIANTNSTEMIFYMLSNNHINDLIVHPFNFANEEILSHFISFLKTLSLRLDPQTIQFFFNAQAQDFPLYSEAIKFFKHPDNMVRIAVRTLSLSVYKLDFPPLREFILERSAVPYFSNVVWFLRDQSLALNQVLDSITKNKADEALELQVDYFYYLQDILHLEIEPLSNILVDQLLCHYVLPTLVGSLTAQPGDREDLLKPWLAMFTLSQLLSLFKQPSLANAVAGALLEPRPVELLRFLVSCPPQYGVSDSLPIASVLINGPLARGPELLGVEGGEGGEQTPSPASSSSEQVANTPSDAKPKRKNDLLKETRAADENLKARSKVDLVQTSHPFLTCPNYADISGGNEFRDYLLNGLNHEDERIVFQSMLLIRTILRNPAIDRRLLDTLPQGRDSLLGRVLRLARPDSPLRVATVALMCELATELSALQSATPHLPAVENMYAHFAGLVRDRFSGSVGVLLVDLLQDEYPLMQQSLTDHALMSASHFYPSLPEGVKRGPVDEIRREIQIFLLLRRLCRKFQHREEEDALAGALMSPPTVKLGTEVPLMQASALACICAVNNSKVHMLVLIDAELLLLVQRNPDQTEMGRVQLVIPLAHQEAFPNRFHPGVLHITLRSATRPHEACRRLKVGPVSEQTDSLLQSQRDKPLWNLTLLFQDAQQCALARQHFEQQRTRLRERSVASILQQLPPPASVQPR